MPGRSPTPGRSPAPGRSAAPALGRWPPAGSAPAAAPSPRRNSAAAPPIAPPATAPARFAGRVLGRAAPLGGLTSRKFCNWLADGRVATPVLGRAALPGPTPVLGRVPALGRAPGLGRVPAPGRVPALGSVPALGREALGRETLGAAGRGEGRLTAGVRAGEGRDMLAPPREPPPPPRPPPPPPPPRASKSSAERKHTAVITISSRDNRLMTSPRLIGSVLRLFLRLISFVVRSCPGAGPELPIQRRVVGLPAPRRCSAAVPRPPRG
jgi:hypothetical protein